MSKVWLGLSLAAVGTEVGMFLLPVFAGQIILPQAFSIGPVQIRYYGLILAAAVLVGFYIVRSNAWRFGLSKDEAARVVFWAIIIGVIGARLYFVIFDWSQFAANPIDVLKVWQGGLSLFGGLAAGIFFVFWWTRKKLYTPAQLFDLAALALPVTQAIGRFGNLFNYEAYGPATNVPWKMFVPAQFRVNLQTDYFHPLFLYEALANLLIFCLLWSLRGRLKPGGLAIIYIILYGVVRFALEPWRVDSTMLGELRLDQVIAAGLVLIGIILGWRLFKNRPKST